MRVLLPLLLLTGCDALSFRASTRDVDIDDLEPWARPSPGDQAFAITETYAAIPARGRVHADSAAAWALMWRGAGLDEDLLPIDAEGLTLHEIDLDGAERTRPAPGLVIDGPGDALDALEFQTTTDPGLLAFRLDDSLWRLDPDDSEWTTQPLPISVPALTEVGASRSLIRDGLQSATIVEADGTTWDAAPAADAAGYAFGPFDGDVLSRVWWSEDAVCVDRIALATRSVSGTVCHDSDVPLVGIDYDILGGSVDAVQFVLRASTPNQDRFWYVARTDAIERMGWLELTSTDRFYAYPDDPQLDALRVSSFRLQPHDEFWSADGSWAWAREFDRDELAPSQTCGCEGEADPYVCRCIDRRYPIDRLLPHGIGQWWLLGDGLVDTYRKVYAQPVDRLPTTSTTIDPVFVLDEDWTLDDLIIPEDDGLPLLASLPGNDDLETNIGDCVVALDSNGEEPQWAGRGPLLQDGEHYTLTASECAVDDGGPSPIPVTVAYGPDVTGFLFTDVRFARGTGLHPADDPPQFVSDIDAAGLIVRETSGWTALSLDNTGTVHATHVDEVTAAAPRLLRDGRRILLANGDVFDVAQGSVTQTLDLTVPPSDLDQLAGGRLLVEDTASRLALWDLDAEPIVERVVETGARTAQLLDASDTGAIVLEEEDGMIIARDTIDGGEAVLGPVGIAVQGAWLSADGQWGLTAVQTQPAGLQRVALTAWAFTGAGDDFTATSEITCPLCRGWVRHHRDSGQFVQYEDTVTAQQVLLTPTGEPDGLWTAERQVVRTAVASEFLLPSGRTDQWGRAWWREGNNLVAWDVTNGVVVDPIVMQGSPVEAWHGLAWLTFQNYAVRVDDTGIDTHHQTRSTGPIPLDGGVAVTSGGSPFAVRVGNWRPGSAAITESWEVLMGGSALNSDLSTPSWPCLPISLEPRAPQVVDGAPWVCVR